MPKKIVKKAARIARPATTRKPRPHTEPAIVAATNPSVTSCVQQARAYTAALGHDDHALGVLIPALATLDGQLARNAQIGVAGNFLELKPPDPGASSQPARMMYALRVLRLACAAGISDADSMIATIRKLSRAELKLKRGLASA
jgi:hypothetical protein